MSNVSDAVLLAQFARDRSEADFAELVRRHIGLVHSIALRHTSDPQHAQDITQAVFIILARKAGTLSPKTVLPGWLYHTAALTAANFRRAEARRSHREQEAFMQSLLDEPVDDALWQALAPQLEEAMTSLSASDRDAIVLRYFQKNTVAQVAACLGLEENTAQKRLSRALDRLRTFFVKRGVSSTADAIGESISAHSTNIVPEALAKSVMAVAAAKGAATSASTLTLVKGALKVMAWTKTKIIVVGTAVVLVVGTGVVITKNTMFPGEPGYHGRRLSEWMIDVDYGQPPERRQAAGEAIRKMGRKTLPYLLADIGDEKYKKTRPGTSDDHSRQASWAFDALGPIAKSAIPELQRIVERNPGYVPSALAGIGHDAVPVLREELTNENFWVRDNTAAAIANGLFAGKISSNEASPAFSIALENLTYTNTNALFQSNTRWRAAGLLGALKASPEISVPALIAGLQDTNPTVAAECASALSQFGKNAQPAIPELTKAAGSTNNQLSVMAKFAVEQIQSGR